MYRLSLLPQYCWQLRLRFMRWPAWRDRHSPEARPSVDKALRKWLCKEGERRWRLRTHGEPWLVSGGLQWKRTNTGIAGQGTTDWYGEHYLGIEGLSSVWSLGVHRFWRRVYLYSLRSKGIRWLPCLAAGYLCYSKRVFMMVQQLCRHLLRIKVKYRNSATSW